MSNCVRLQLKAVKLRGKHVLKANLLFVKYNEGF